ncbi:MAG: serine protease, partial [Planctomycetota bacterium]
MGLADRAYMQEERPSGAGVLKAGLLLLGLNLAVYLAWCLGARDLLARHALVSRENLAAGRVWTLLGGGLFHADPVHLLTACLAVGVSLFALRRQLGFAGALAVYAAASVGVGLASLAWPLSGGTLAPGEQLASGTGFYVEAHTLLTNAHVVGTAETVRVSGLEGQARVLARDATLDLALIQVQNPGPPLRFAEQSLRSGVLVFASGYGSYGGQNESLVVTRGAIASVRDANARLVFGARVRPGNSGGPLLDSDGRWVGVVCASMELGGVDGFSLAVNGDDARAWIEAQGHTVLRAEGEASPVGVPPEGVQASIVRLEVRQPTGAVEGALLDEAWLDPRIYGASGPAWALLLMALLTWLGSRREGSAEPALGAVACLIFLFGILDPTGKLRAETVPNETALDHGYHLAGAFVGAAAWHWSLPERLDTWLARRGRRRERVAQAVAAVPAPAPEPAAAAPAALSAAERERLDALLRVVGERGLDALSP